MRIPAYARYVRTEQRETGIYNIYNISTTNRKMLKGYLMADETKGTTEEQLGDYTISNISDVELVLRALAQKANRDSYKGQLHELRGGLAMLRQKIAEAELGQDTTEEQQDETEHNLKKALENASELEENWRTAIAEVASLKAELKDLKAALQTEIDLRKEAEKERDREREKHEKATATIRDKVDKLKESERASTSRLQLAESLRKKVEQQREELESLRAKLAEAQTDTDPPHFVESRHLIGKVTKPEQAEALDREIELLRNNGWYPAHETVNTIVISDNAPKMPTTTIKSLKIMRWERVVSIEAKQQPDDSASDDDKTIDMPSPEASEEGTDATAELQEKSA